MDVADTSPPGLASAIRSARTWAFDFEPERPAATLATRGTGLRIERAADASVEIWADYPNGSSRVATLGMHEARVFGTGGGIIPCYARYRRGRMQFSNLAFNLIEHGERVRIKTFAVMQHFLGVPYPLDNIFSDLMTLEASAAYRACGTELVYDSTRLTPVSGAGFDDAMQVIHSQWHRLTSSGRPLCVFLSGGYDSRLNLALAQHYSAKFGNPVFAFHEHKDDTETTIAKAVAEVAGVRLTVKSREEFVPCGRPVESDRAFIKLHSGTYRDNLLRWHYYFSYIKEQHPDGALIGFGAEAHKGKFYGHVQRMPEDFERVFGIDSAVVHQLARYLGIRRYDRNPQRALFGELNRHAAIYPEASSRVDFVHYQTYVANGYGKRCHSLWQLFGFPFPFLDDDFLRIVFSMRRADKEGFLIVVRALEALNPRLMSIPLTSANRKALGVKKHTLTERASKRLRNLLRPMYRRSRPVRPKGRASLVDMEQEHLRKMQPRSEVTRGLHDHLLRNLANVPGARLDYAMQLLLYFQLLEDELDASLEWA